MPGKLYIGLKRELVLNTWKLIIIYKYFSSVRFLTNMVIHEPSALIFLFPLLQLPPAPKLFLFVTPEQKPFERQLLEACLHAVVRVREDGRQIALTVPVCLNWVQMTSNPGAKVWERYHKSYEDLCHLRSKYFITSVLNKVVFCIHTIILMKRHLNTHSRSYWVRKDMQLGLEFGVFDSYQSHIFELKGLIHRNAALSLSLLLDVLALP